MALAQKPLDDDLFYEALESDAEKRSAVLADWEGEKVIVECVFKKATAPGTPPDPWTALVDNVEVTLRTKERHNIGHTWVQRAAPLKDLKLDQRVGFTATVKSYSNGTKFGLYFPTGVRLLNGPVALVAYKEPLAPVPKIAPPPPPSPVQILRQAKLIAAAFESAERTADLLKIVKTHGGWDKLAELKKWADGVGGLDEAMELLGMLKP